MTRNRTDSLERAIKSLRGQNVQPFEIIISDDSDDEFVPQVKTISQRWNCRYISGSRRGLYANRNQAALACEGSHIRTMDDDHILPAGHLERCLIAVASDPLSIWTTGEIQFLNGKYYATADTANQLYPSGIGGPVIDPNDSWAIADGSTIYPQHIFHEGHYMVQEFGYGSSYLEFGAYLYQRGFHSRCIPGALIEHHLNDSSLARSRRKNTQELESVLYAVFCYNCFFKPNFFRGIRYVLSTILRSKFDLQLILKLPRIIKISRRRWFTDLPMG